MTRRGEAREAVLATPDSARFENLLGKAIGDIGIPPCPAVLAQIKVEMDKDEPDFMQVEAIVCSDVALAAGLIALANSPFFGVRHRVGSVRGALQVLGLGMAGRAVAGLILRKLFPAPPAMERFWDSSARIARLSGWLVGGAYVGVRIGADEAYTFGLLRDCGIPVLLKRFPRYPAALKEANAAEHADFTAIEESHCQTNHASVGGLLSQAWWLPDDVSLAIRHHHDCHRLGRDRRAGLTAASLELIAVAHLAEHLLQEHTGLSRTREWQKAGSACLAILGIDEPRLAALLAASASIAGGEQ